jgi:hypothetical protein
MNSKAKTILLVISVLLLVSVFLTDCSSPEYILMEADNEICHISFEYPSRFNMIDGKDVLERWGYYVVYFELDDKEQPMIVPGSGTQMVTYMPGSMKVNIYDPNPRDVTAFDEIERELEFQQNWSGYEVFERSTITVDGISAEYAFFANNTMLIFPAEAGDDPPPRYMWEVYFEYNGLIWNLSAFSEESMVEAVEAGFKHMLNTFKILN